MVEILKQDQYSPLSLSKQVMIIYVGTKGFLDDIPAHDVRAFEKEFHAYMEKEYPDVAHELEKTKVLSDEMCKKINSAVEKLKAKWKK